MTKPASAKPSSASHISRRQFLTYGAGTAALLALPPAVAMNMSGMNMAGVHSKPSPLPKPVFSGALPIPPVYTGVMGRDKVREFHLHMAGGHSVLSDGLKTATWGYNGAVLGPALRIPRGQPLRLYVHNQLDQSTTTHWHGAHVPGTMDGGPQSLILPGKTWTYGYTIDQPEATLWYHPHPAGRTGPHVYGGLAGLYLVEDGTDRRLGLPHHWGIDDIPVIVQDRLLDAQGRLVYMPQAMDVMGMKGNRFLINGRESPILKAPAQWVRLRLLNASNARIYNFALSGDRAFYVIASDAGYLEAPVSVQRLLLAPAERAEILLDLRALAGKRLWLRSDSAAVVPGLSLHPMDSDHFDRSNFDLLEIHVGSATGSAGRLPDHLVPIPTLHADAPSRRFELRGMPMDKMSLAQRALETTLHNGPAQMSMGVGRQPLFSINNQYMNMKIINQRLRLGSTEIWEVYNDAEMAHTFHVHGTSFQILSCNGKAPPAYETGWKDTLLIRRTETIRFIAHYGQPAPDDFPYMYHCHMLEHEDNGMMGQFTVS
ncbi:multicopper oxidase domain-containing protein [Acidithiobacillus sulfurivorans]|uniref:Multicopper oxidase CueO n=1 Tax=Acidithiobacillus sulfurivorans TaxID=1958756 RepID=A0ABS6A1V7_9PROT|nr:multicopper oxidase domain-containing protein [Acidithiobacillus sulfurivorans]MBU2760863.1 multicopper oxidase domain-containing protein [Acidithiobacillus sulfurivorans]